MFSTPVASSRSWIRSSAVTVLLRDIASKALIAPSRRTPSSPPLRAVMSSGSENSPIPCWDATADQPSASCQTSTGQLESAVKRRLERLRSTGILYFTVQHDRESLGHGISAMFWLSIASLRT